MKRLLTFALLFSAVTAFGADALKVDIKIGTQLVDREPVGVADTFSVKSPEIVAWTRVTGATEPTEIMHVWLYNGKEVAWAELPIRSSSYRTWSIRPLKEMAGKWVLQVKDVDGRLLGSKDFVVK
jgi:hypothetical protein